MATLTRHTGLGFKLFGKPIKLGSIVRKAMETLVDEVCTKFGGSTVGGYAAEKVKGWLSNFFTKVENSLNQFKTTAPTITAAEQNIIKAWTEEKLAPFANNMAEQANAIAGMSTTAQKVAAINSIEATIDALQDYLAFKDSAGLGIEGINQRVIVIYWVFYPIHQLLVEYAAQMQLTSETVVVSTAGLNVSSLITGQLNATVETTKYTAPAIAATPITNPNTLPAATLPTTTPVTSVLPATNPTTSVLPATTTLNTGGSKAQAGNAPTGTKQAQTTIQNTGATSVKAAISQAKANAAKNASDSTAGLIIGSVVVAGVLYMAFKGGSKKATGMNGRRALKRRTRKK